jgi:hypothetical protein
VAPNDRFWFTSFYFLLSFSFLFWFCTASTRCDSHHRGILLVKILLVCWLGTCQLLWLLNSEFNERVLSHLNSWEHVLVLSPVGGCYTVPLIAPAPYCQAVFPSSSNASSSWSIPPLGRLVEMNPEHVLRTINFPSLSQLIKNKFPGRLCTSWVTSGAGAVPVIFRTTGALHSICGFTMELIGWEWEIRHFRISGAATVCQFFFFFFWYFFSDHDLILGLTRHLASYQGTTRRCCFNFFVNLVAHAQ